MDEVNWQDDESVVRAVCPRWTNRAVMYPPTISRSHFWMEDERGRIMSSIGTHETKAKLFASARQHPVVVAFEKANRPAEVGRPKPHKVLTWAHITGVIGSGCRMRSHKQGAWVKRTDYEALRPNGMRSGRNWRRGMERMCSASLWAALAVGAAITLAAPFPWFLTGSLVCLAVMVLARRTK